MIWAIKQFWQYLFGYKFVLITDHQPLKWQKSLKDPPPKLTRWVMILQQYDFEVEYRAGKNRIPLCGENPRPFDPERGRNKQRHDPSRDLARAAMAMMFN